MGPSFHQHFLIHISQLGPIKRGKKKKKKEKKEKKFLSYVKYNGW
jgi:hypothetical protein